MKREHEIKLRTILQKQFYSGRITKKKYKKELKYIKKLKQEDENKRTNQGTTDRVILLPITGYVIRRY